jgi:hypothetical protein
MADYFTLNTYYSCTTVSLKLIFFMADPILHLQKQQIYLYSVNFYFIYTLNLL